MVGWSNVQGGGLNSNKPLIHVNAPLGSAVNFVLNGSSKTISSNKAFVNIDGVTADYYYTAKNGVYTITATSGSESVTKELEVTTQMQYDIVLSYRVPSIYQAVEYIERPQNSGAYFNTNIIPASTDFVEIKFKMLTCSNYPWAIGLQLSSSSYWGITYDPGGTMNVDYNSSNIISVVGYLNKDNVVQFKNANMIRLSNDNGATFREFTKTQSSTPSNPLLLFAVGPSLVGKGANSMRIKEATIADAVFVPCYRKSDNVPGFWNQRDKVFLTNAGADSVTVGPNI